MASTVAPVPAASLVLVPDARPQLRSRRRLRSVVGVVVGVALLSGAGAAAWAGLRGAAVPSSLGAAVSTPTPSTSRPAPNPPATTPASPPDRDPPPSTVPPPLPSDAGQVVVEGTEYAEGEVVVGFAPDSAELTGVGRRALAELADRIPPSASVAVVGYVWAGTPARVLRLDAERAQVVAAFLSSRGVKAARVVAGGRKMRGVLVAWSPQTTTRGGSDASSP